MFNFEACFNPRVGSPPGDVLRDIGSHRESFTTARGVEFGHFDVARGSLSTVGPAGDDIGDLPGSSIFLEGETESGQGPQTTITGTKYYAVTIVGTFHM